ncbi:MAG: helix-turn-helix domain-containing protein [Usitatibacteraceae bacterium]
MDYLQQIQRGIDYIEANLEYDIQSADVARHAGISHWHFQRIFKALTNETLKTYIRSRRFAQSLETLANTNERVLDIALAAGFDTQASFTRAFKKAFSVTPAHYRENASALAVMRKVRFDADYLGHIHNNLSLEPEIYEQPEMHVVGMRTCFYGIDSEKNNMAQKLPQLWASFLPRLDQVPHRSGEGGYGVIQQTAARADELEYWAAVPFTKIDRLPRGLTRLRVAASRYARFAHRGRVANVNMTVNYIYSSWLLRSGMRHTYGCDLEFYGEEYEVDSDTSVIYYAIPIGS